MRIGIDATAIGAAGGGRGGVYQYVLQLLRQFARIAPEHDYRLLFALARARHRPAIAQAVAGLGPAGWTVSRARVPDRWLRRARVPVELLVGAVDVFHAPAHVGLPAWRGAPVVTAHDLSYRSDRSGALPPALLDEEGLRLWSMRRRFFAELESSMELSLRDAALVIANSQHTAQSLSRAFGVSPAKIRVTHLAARPEVAWTGDPEQIAAVRRRHGLPESYGVYLGTLDPNKNLETLLEGYARYRARRGAAALALVGAPLWYGRLLRRHAERLGLASCVHFLGAVDDAELGALLCGAQWSVSPSALEGFCIPALEAMACRTPVIAAAGGALPEVVGAAALLVHPRSPEAFADAMERLADDKALREALAELGVQRARQFSWEKTARATLQAYREAAQLRGCPAAASAGSAA